MNDATKKATETATNDWRADCAREYPAMSAATKDAIEAQSEESAACAVEGGRESGEAYRLCPADRAELRVRLGRLATYPECVTLEAAIRWQLSCHDEAVVSE